MIKFNHNSSLMFASIHSANSSLWPVRSTSLTKFQYRRQCSCWWTVITHIWHGSVDNRSFNLKKPFLHVLHRLPCVPLAQSIHRVSVTSSGPRTSAPTYNYTNTNPHTVFDTLRQSQTAHLAPGAAFWWTRPNTSCNWHCHLANFIEI